MIVKIWPIHADNSGDKSKPSGIEGLKNAYEYVTDSEKVIVKQDDIHTMTELIRETVEQNEADFQSMRVLNYMSNSEKIEGKYISGYMCDPDTAITDFNLARQQTLKIIERDPAKESGAIAFHMVQSFPVELDISDEEVHQCGIELAEKINAHQAIICSHVHPVKDEEGEVTGKCKHNHILFNAYIHPSKLDQKNLDVVKYHDCKETYALLRKWNDEIAIAHGLPIIRNPDDDRSYSWAESDAINKGLSWKQRVRLDIEASRRASTCWKEFVEQMNALGYRLKEGKYVTYDAPDNEHSIRDKTLGRQYTKENLELYWEFQNRTYRPAEQVEIDNPSPALLDFVLEMPGNLTVAVPVGMSSSENRGYVYLPIEKAEQTNAALVTYFNDDERYDICDENNRSVFTATGREIIECMEQLRNGKQELLEKQKDPEREKERHARKHENWTDSKRYYVNVLFINSRTKRPYRTRLYDQNGRRRSVIELMLLLALAVLKKEDGLWDVSSVPEEQKNDPVFAPRNWKVQNMIDAIYLAQDEGIETPAQLERRLNEAGAAFSRARSSLRKVTHAKEKMETLNAAVVEYRQTAVIAEKVLAMPDSPEKEQTIAEYSDVLDQYRAAKAVLHRYDVTTEEKLVDFERRYLIAQNDIAELTERLDQATAEYSKLKKLNYHVTLAQNVQYCYGPGYVAENAYSKEEALESDEARNKREEQRVEQGKENSVGALPDKENERKDSNDEISKH